MIDIRGIHPSYHRGAKDLVYMHVHESEGAVFEDKIEYDVQFRRRWTVCG